MFQFDETIPGQGKPEFSRFIVAILKIEKELSLAAGSIFPFRDNCPEESREFRHNAHLEQGLLAVYCELCGHCRVSMPYILLLGNFAHMKLCRYVQLILYDYGPVKGKSYVLVISAPDGDFQGFAGFVDQMVVNCVIPAKSQFLRLHTSGDKPVISFNEA